ncbi:methyl-accepting chemotaxis protein [Vibrio hannami]|uniref:methyl-accepting chemotaxis protein n=1 Tax=Vibrio hannami TaxID=2717094 RepID=UPI002410A7B5|nr:methyl-accepting chemotaxis protein [Vibrio hannami]MDG3087505.1 methyl-accepting chemotaxis protein [Vibrio hannami]
MHKYLRSFGVTRASQYIFGTISLSILFACFGYLQAGFLTLLLSSIFVWRVLVAINKDITLLSHMSASYQSAEAQELDTTQAGPLYPLFPAIDNVIRLLRRELHKEKAVNQEMSYSAQELARNALEVASNSENQATATTSSASAATEISLSIREVTSHIEHSLKIMEESNGLCQKTKEALMYGQNQVDEVDKHVRQSATNILELDKKLDSVTSISNFITDLAAQTNLLALNAAIEAARAGEQGRGFSVVADEVRMLAQRSHESASAITSQISEVTQRMENVAAQVNNVVEITQECRNSVHTAYDSLELVVSSMDDVTGQVSGIAVVSEQQAVAAHEISVNMEQVAATADKNSHMAKQNANVSEYLKKLTDHGGN